MSQDQLRITENGQSTGIASESALRYPFLLPANSWRRALKVGLGRLALALRPRQAQRLLERHDPTAFSFTDRLMLAAWVSRATADDWTTLSEIHQRFWAGQGGAIFNTAPEIAHRFDDWLLHSRPLEFLRSEFGSQQCAALCEIGSGNGLALDYMSQQLATVPRFIGIDINTEATCRNTERWQDDPRLEFVTADAVEWIEEHAKTNWTYFANAGVLEYFPQPSVTRLYRHTAALAGPAWWVLTEPIHGDYDLATETDSRPQPPEFSFSHNHPHLLRQAGWEVVEQSETEVAGIRFLTVCARMP